MIVLLPLLIDDTISPTVIPGLCKNLESFALIYKMDMILKICGLPADAAVISWARNAASDIANTYGGTPGKVIAPYIRDGVEMLGEQKGGPYDAKEIEEYKSKLRRGDEYYKSQLRKDEEDRKSKKDKEAERNSKEEERSYKFRTTYSPRDSKVGPLNYSKSISMEPTVAMVSSKKGAGIVGVKVVPYAINGDSFLEQIMKDRSLSYFDSVVERMSRKMVRLVQAGMRKIPFSPAKDQGIYGDPFKDIIHAKTRYGSGMFVLLNYARLEDDEMFRDSGGLGRLFKLGWNSVMMADDVNRRCIMCMKEFQGLCSIIPYSFIYSSLGPEGSKAYGDMQDLKRSISPMIGGQRVNSHSIFSESLVNEKITNYRVD